MSDNTFNQLFQFGLMLMCIVAFIVGIWVGRNTAK
jgi:hypothetical protein